MKNKIINILFVLALLVTFSCDNELDQTPYDGLTDEQLFSTTEGFENAMKGVYSGFRSYGLYGESTGLHICPDVFSDNLIQCKAGRNTQSALFELRNTAINESFNLYEKAYKVISRANRIIDNIDRIKDENNKKKYLSQARAIRGMLHFDIARTYCKIPTQSDDANTSLGIVYSKKYAPAILTRRAGTTVENTYKEIITDLEYAAENITNNGPGKLNKNAVLGVLSRVYLYMGENSKVIEVANKIKVEIAPKKDFANIWTDEYLKNVLFYLIITEEDGTAIGNSYSQSSEDGIRSEFVVSYPLYQLYKNEDIRKGTTIKTSIFSEKNYNHVAKYLGKPNGITNLTYPKYIRMEEVLLNQAEAYANMNEDSKALDLLDKLRKERYENFNTKNESGKALKEAILLERRLELAFEGDRYYTLKRLKKDLVRDTSGDLADGKGSSIPESAQILKAGNYRWQQPIPQGAFDANPKMNSEDQNPGY